MPKIKQTVEHIRHNLQLDEEINMHEKGWKVQRGGWILMFLIMLFGILGLFGDGLLSQRKPTIGDISAEYDRFFRYESEMKVLVQSEGEHISSITLPQDYLKHFRLVRIIPDYETNIASLNNITFQFSGSENRVVTIYLISKDYGSVSGTMKVNDHQIKLNHFIYP